MLCWESDGQNSDLFDCGYVLKRVPVNASSGRLGGERRPPFPEVGLLCVERYPLASNQLTALDLHSTGLTAQTITNKVAPSTLGGAEPSSWYQDTSYDFQPFFPRLIEKRDVIFVLESRHAAEVSHFATISIRPTELAGRTALSPLPLYRGPTEQYKEYRYSSAGLATPFTPLGAPRGGGATPRGRGG